MLNNYLIYMQIDCSLKFFGLICIPRLFKTLFGGAKGCALTVRGDILWMHVEVYRCFLDRGIRFWYISCMSMTLTREVSRTFALTIPLLPRPLIGVVSDAYLICRILDTIEDETDLPYEEQKVWVERYIDVIAERGDAALFATELAPHIAKSVAPAELKLLKSLPSIIQRMRGYKPLCVEAIGRCVRIMGTGMLTFQRMKSMKGVKDLAALDEYCYYVAGVVGEMLTDLFASVSKGVMETKEQLMELAISFGQGLQMTNIIKDDIGDMERLKMRWIPEEFQSEGGIKELIGLAKLHLNRAIDYILLIPKRDLGIRHFCLSTTMMALLTLRKLGSKSPERKISKRSVMALIPLSKQIARSNTLIRLCKRI